MAPMTPKAPLEWQPIRSAPQDGTYVLLWWRSCTRASVGRFDYDEDFVSNPRRTKKRGWRSEGDACIPVNQDDCTHWMPLPAPPKP